MPPSADPWQETFRVRSYEVEPGGHASVQTLCHYFEEAAGNHAQALGLSVEQLASQGLTWVLSRLHVQVAAFPRWRDTVRVTTWPSGQNGLFALREFQVHDEGGRLLARATSGWVMIDVQRRRPVRLPGFLRAYLFPRPDRAVEDDFTRLRPPPDGYERARRFHVRYSDLDLNRHVNNVRYVEWAVETLPPAFLETHRLAGLEIHFRAETGYDAAVIAEAASDAAAGTGTGFWHRLRREDDDRDVAVARTRWRPAAPSD
ncbi:MAG: acyl-ACP thioesterase [Rhodothermaceae bacterium]|nr:MAG: acyl-ACP thioesterase [Rhodothermaceae bacterium]